jgi:hypothetical protein
MRLVVLLVIGLSACGDDLSLVVEVNHRIPVARTVISVYESDSVDCTKIEFGDLDASALSAALVAEEIHDATGVTGSLDGISRTERKYIVARGYDADGTLLTAGCEFKDEVTGNNRVTVNADEALTVSAILEPATLADQSYRFVVIASAPDGGPPAAKRQVSWQVYGPDGTKPIRSELADIVPPEPNQPQQADWTPKQNACTNLNGVTRIHPVPPHQIGGFATRIRASWAANVLPLQSSLSRVDPTAITILHPPAGVTRPCAVKVSGGEHRLVCIDTQGATIVARELKVSANAGRGTATQTNIVTLAVAPIAVLSVPAGANARDVYLVESGGNLVPLFAGGASTLIGCQACTVSDAVYAPACTDDNEAVIYLQTGATQLRTFALVSKQRGLVTGFVPTGDSIVGMLDSIDLEQAGCVTQVVPMLGTKQRQAVTFSATSTVDVNGTLVPIPSSHGFYNCGPLACSKLDFPVSEAGVTFVQADATDNRIIGASGDASGVVVSSWVVIPDPAGGGVHRLIERDRVPAASVPNRIVAGKLDDDAGYDLVWDFATKRGSTLELAYSRMAGGQRLEAVSNASLVLVSDLQLDDISNDGFPDLILIGAAGTAVPVVVIPTHVAPLETITAAEQCN